MTLLGPILPIFIIILLGYLCGRFGLLDEQATTVLSRLVFYIVMPVTLFIDVARLPIHTVLNWPYLLAYFIAFLFGYGCRHGWIALWLQA